MDVWREQSYQRVTFHTPLNCLLILYYHHQFCASILLTISNIHSIFLANLFALVASRLLSNKSCTLLTETRQWKQEQAFDYVIFPGCITDFNQEHENDDGSITILDVRINVNCWLALDLWPLHHTTLSLRLSYTNLSWRCKIRFCDFELIMYISIHVLCSRIGSGALIHEIYGYRASATCTIISEYSYRK